MEQKKIHQEFLALFKNDDEWKSLAYNIFSLENFKNKNSQKIFNEFLKKYNLTDDRYEMYTLLLFAEYIRITALSQNESDILPDEYDISFLFDSIHAVSAFTVLMGYYTSCYLNEKNEYYPYTLYKLSCIPTSVNSDKHICRPSTTAFADMWKKDSNAHSNCDNIYYTIKTNEFDSKSSLYKNASKDLTQTKSIIFPLINYRYGELKKNNVLYLNKFLIHASLAYATHCKTTIEQLKSKLHTQNERKKNYLEKFLINLYQMYCHIIGEFLVDTEPYTLISIYKTEYGFGCISLFDQISRMAVNPDYTPATKDLIESQYNPFIFEIHLGRDLSLDSIKELLEATRIRLAIIFDICSSKETDLLFSTEIDRKLSNFIPYDLINGNSPNHYWAKYQTTLDQLKKFRSCENINNMLSELQIALSHLTSSQIDILCDYCIKRYSESWWRKAEELFT